MLRSLIISFSFWKSLAAIAKAAPLLQMLWDNLDFFNLKSFEINKGSLRFSIGWRIRFWEIIVAIASALQLSIQHYGCCNLQTVHQAQNSHQQNSPRRIFFYLGHFILFPSISRQLVGQTPNVIDHHVMKWQVHKVNKVKTQTLNLVRSIKDA